MADYTFEDLKDDDEEPTRYTSVDALRGFDMFWILGADALARALPLTSGKLAINVGHEEVESMGMADRAIHTVADQLEHVPWDGFHFYDLIFPLFVFIMGVSTVFSLDKIVREKGTGAAIWRVIRRSLVLYGLGLFYYGALTYKNDPQQIEHFRYVGVLQRIAMCYLAGGLIYLSGVRWKGLIGISLAILIGYWGLMTFVHVPGHGGGNWTEGTNLANYIDTHYLPGYKWDGDWDPEGLFSSIPAVASGLLGIMGGLLLSNREMSAATRIGILLAAGFGCIAAGYGWHEAPAMNCPIIKKLWTSSFVLYAGGWSFLMLAFFHLVIDVARFEIWARPFVWIGMNPITLYVLRNLVGGYTGLVRRVLHQHWITQTQPWGTLVVGVISVLIPIWIAWVMYRKKIFLRV